MEKYPNAGPGIRKMLISSVVGLVCVFVSYIPYVNLLALTASFVVMLVCLSGLQEVAKDIEECRTAFILSIVNVFIGVMSMFAKNNVGFYIVLKIISAMLSFSVTFFFLRAMRTVLLELNQKDVEKNIPLVWKVNLAGNASSVISLALGKLILIATLAVLISFASSLVYIFFMMALSKVFPQEKKSVGENIKEKMLKGIYIDSSKKKREKKKRR